MKRRVLNLLIALDQLAWVIVTLGKGYPDETISAALWRMEQQGKIAGRVFRPLIDALFRPLIDALFRPLERDHCRKSFESERRGAHLPGYYRTKG